MTPSALTHAVRSACGGAASIAEPVSGTSADTIRSAEAGDALPFGGVWLDGHICYGDPGPDWMPGDAA